MEKHVDSLKKKINVRFFGFVYLLAINEKKKKLYSKIFVFRVCTFNFPILDINITLKKEFSV